MVQNKMMWVCAWYMRPRKRGRGRKGETGCFHLVDNPVRLPLPGGTHWSPPQHVVSTRRHLSGWDDSAEDQPQTGRHNPPTPSLTSHHQCCPGHKRHIPVQRARRPPVWRRQLVEASANRDATGLPECTVNSRQREKHSDTHTHRLPKPVLQASCGYKLQPFTIQTVHNMSVVHLRYGLTF